MDNQNILKIFIRNDNHKYTIESTSNIMALCRENNLITDAELAVFMDYITKNGKSTSYGFCGGGTVDGYIDFVNCSNAKNDTT